MGFVLFLLHHFAPPSLDNPRFGTKVNCLKNIFSCYVPSECFLYLNRCNMFLNSVFLFECMLHRTSLATLSLYLRIGVWCSILCMN